MLIFEDFLHVKNMYKITIFHDVSFMLNIFILLIHFLPNLQCLEHQGHRKLSTKIFIRIDAKNKITLGPVNFY